jgi:hypothetical protein
VQVVRRWLLDPFPGQAGQLQPTQAVTVVQRVMMLERMGAVIDPLVRSALEQQLRELLYELCTSPKLSEVCGGGTACVDV